jgi:predicted N-acetyltransferase YhbS
MFPDCPSSQYRFYPPSSPVLQLDNLCTDFRLQHKGIGAALIERGLIRAKERGLSVQTEASPHGWGFYRRFGFKEVGEWVVKARETIERDDIESIGKLRQGEDQAEPDEGIRLLVLRLDKE